MQHSIEVSSQANILIVDDIQDNLRFLSNIFKQQGYQVRSVTNGELALKTIEAKLPDIILLDIMMPIMDGYQVCQILKSSDTTRDIPIIFLSALDETFDKLRAFELGGVDYITKPFYIEEVIARVEAHLTIQRQKERLKKEIEAHKRKDELLQGVLNSSSDGVAAFESIRNEKGQIVDFIWLIANPMATMTMGKTTQQLIGSTLLQDSSTKIFQKLFPSLVTVVENSSVLEEEYYYQEDAFAGWLHIIAVKLGDGFALTFRDITERKQLELSLKDANRQLQEEANVDSLTKIANRRRFDEYLAQEWQRCIREQKPLSLILCDVDYFKLYNDTYGHQAGDDCLTQIAQAIKAAVKRPGDLAVRYGGEEFAVILPNTNARGAFKVAEAIRNIVKQKAIPHVLSQISEYVTLSLGIASTVPDRDSFPDTIISSADQALYDAKKQGRDRLILKIVDRQLF
ncbi:MAG: diguanylate cyclase [Cyanobacteria bacterium J083]|nr:MAG: diguanylate cyclase [Cyanobacteria bacterium J083]